VAAQPASPANGTQLSFYKQPVTLVVANAKTSTIGGAVIDHIEVAIDDAFTTVVQTKDATQDNAGETRVTLAPLNDASTYFWRVRASAGTTIGPLSRTAKFAIGPKVTIQAPFPIEPAESSFQNKRPTLTVSNAVRAGPVGRLDYRFEIGTDSTFSGTVVAGSVSEGDRRTSFTLSVDLASGTIFYWRVQVRDAETGVRSPYATPRTFVTVAPEDGRFLYRLVLDTPASCHLPPGFGSPSDEYAYDGELTVSGGQLRFQQPQPGTYQHNLMVDIMRIGDQISGTIGTGSFGLVTFATARATNGVEIGLWSRRSTVDGALFSGRAVFPSQLTATFDADVRIWNSFGDGGGLCAGSGFIWLLTPIN
jgi:hypothetical protein